MNWVARKRPKIDCITCPCLITEFIAELYTDGVTH